MVEEGYRVEKSFIVMVLALPSRESNIFFILSLVSMSMKCFIPVNSSIFWQYLSKWFLIIFRTFAMSLSRTVRMVAVLPAIYLIFGGFLWNFGVWYRRASLFSLVEGFSEYLVSSVVSLSHMSASVSLVKWYVSLPGVGLFKPSSLPSFSR